MSDLEDAQLAVRDLDRCWGDAYDIWFDARYFGRRIDGTGQTLTADTSEALAAALTADRESAAEQLARAVITAYQRRGVEIVHAGYWQAIIAERNGQTIVTRDDRAALLARLRELDIAGELPG